MSLRVDGQDATQTDLDARITGLSIPAMDSIEETAIQTSNYSAEFGQAAAGS